jgi:hypothetical protein
MGDTRADESRSDLAGSATLDGYLCETVRVWLGLPASQRGVVPSLPEPLVRRLLRVEEYERPRRDQWDCWEFRFCESYWGGVLWDPEIDRWLVEQAADLAGSAIAVEPRWPDDHPFGICLTHDVDLVSTVLTPGQLRRSLEAAFSGRPPGRSERFVRFARPGVRLASAARWGVRRAPVTETLELTAEIEAAYGVPASYMFTTYPGDPYRFDCLYEASDWCTFRGRRSRISDVMRQLVADGHDVGLHGSYASGFERDVLATERNKLSAEPGIEPTTTRQHFLRWNIRSTPRMQQDAGLSADSTLGFNRNLGFRAGTSLPFHWFDLERDISLNLLEVPFAVHDGALFRADCLELDLDLARESVRAILDVVAGTSGLATFIFHPNNLEDDRYAELLRFLIEYGKEANAWFASLAGVDRWWRERELKLAAA